MSAGRTCTSSLSTVPGAAAPSPAARPASRRLRPGRAALLALGAAAIAPLALAGCSFSSSIGGNAVAQADVEQQISDTLAQQMGQAPDSVDCPDDLPAEVDSTMTCTLTSGSDVYDVTVTVTSVEDSTVNFDINVADAPN